MGNRLLLRPCFVPSLAHYDFNAFWTMTSSPPDISSLTLAPQRTRPAHDAYDPSGYPDNNRFQHFQTSPAVVPSPGLRRALPSVIPLSSSFPPLLVFFLNFFPIFFHSSIDI